jgi:anti-anti-sigma factor
MNITTRDSGNIKIVDLDGKLDSNSSDDAQKHFEKMIEQGASKILVNLEKCEFVASAGLRVLLLTAKQLKGNGGEIRICTLNENVQEVFDISGFNTILNVFPSEPEALSDF